MGLVSKQALSTQLNLSHTSSRNILFSSPSPSFRSTMANRRAFYSMWRLGELVFMCVEGARSLRTLPFLVILSFSNLVQCLFKASQQPFASTTNYQRWHVTSGPCQPGACLYRAMIRSSRGIPSPMLSISLIMHIQTERSSETRPGRF